MNEAGLAALLLVAAALFAAGLFGVLARRDIMFQLIALEVAMCAPALAFISVGAFHGDAAGQGMFVLTLTLAAAEVPIGLALLLRIRRQTGSGDGDSLDGLRG